MDAVAGAQRGWNVPVPSVVIALLHPSKLDVNDPNGSSAVNYTYPEWGEYHSFVDAARAEAQSSECGQGLLIELSTHGHIDQLLELSYLLTASQLAQVGAFRERFDRSLRSHLSQHITKRVRPLHHYLFLDTFLFPE